VTTLHQIRSEKTRERLLNAAMTLLQTKGYGQLSMHEVAREAGMTAGAVQHHFATKATLMLEVLARVVAQLEVADDFWPSKNWPLKRRADHFVREAWARLYGQPRFAVAWTAYLAARDDPAVMAHIVSQRAALSESVHGRMAEIFPRMCQGEAGKARMDFVLSALRGMGLVAPFAAEPAIAPQLQVLSNFIQVSESTGDPS